MDHLHAHDAIHHWASIQTDAERSIGDRMLAVERTYVATPRDKLITEAVDRVIRLAINSERQRYQPGAQNLGARGIIVTGESGSGKTTAVDRALESHPAFPGYGTRKGCALIVKVSVRGPLTLANFVLDLLRAAGYPVKSFRRSDSAKSLLPLLREHIRRTGIRFILVDDVHVLLQAKNIHELENLRNLFLSLLNDIEHPVIVMFAGTLGTFAGLDDPDGQLARRCEVIKFQRLEDADQKMIRRTLETLAERGGVSLATEDCNLIVPRLMAACRYRLGRVCEFGVFAIEEAMRTGNALTLETFATVFTRGTAAPASRNPFVADDWRSQHIPNFFAKQDEEADHHGSRPSRRRATGRKTQEAR